MLMSYEDFLNEYGLKDDRTNWINWKMDLGMSYQDALDASYKEYVPLQEKTYKVELYDNQNNKVYETEIDACDETSAIEQAWDEYCGGGYGCAELID